MMQYFPLKANDFDFLTDIKFIKVICI